MSARTTVREHATAEQALAHRQATAVRYPGPSCTVPPQRSAPPATRSGRRLGPVVAAAAAALVVLGGLVAGALMLFGPRTLDDAAIEAEIGRIMDAQAGLVAADAACPDDVPVQVGGTFTCTATVDGHGVAFSVRQDDGAGNVTISSTGFVVLARVEADLVRQLRDRAGFDATAHCGPAGRRIVVGGPGTAVECTIADAVNPADMARVTGTVTDGEGTVGFGSGT